MIRAALPNSSCFSHPRTDRRVNKVLALALLVCAWFLLAMAWTVGVQPLLETVRYALPSATAAGRIVESWLALDLDPGDIRQDQPWPAFATTTPCTVVEYEAGTGSPLRRAFCGDSWSMKRVSVFAPTDITRGVPLSFLRDANGFMLREVRMSKAALDWLSANPPSTTAGLSKPPPTTALGALKEQGDDPARVAVSSWSTPASTIPLVFVRGFPKHAVPAAFVEARLDKRFRLRALGSAIFLVGFGWSFWKRGMNLLLPAWRRNVRRLLIIAPLATVPWWGDAVLFFLHPTDGVYSAVLEGMFRDFSNIHLYPSAPADARLAAGERLVWHLDEGAYADTFGRVRFAPPDSLLSRDGARYALQKQVGDQVHTLDATAQAALFERLKRQEYAGFDKVQEIFLPAARRIVRDENASATARGAAKEFLIARLGPYGWQ